MSARGPFPQTRMRRLRASAFARDMVRESTNPRFHLPGFCP